MYISCKFKWILLFKCILIHKLLLKESVMLWLDMLKLRYQAWNYYYDNSYAWNHVYFDEKCYLDKNYVNDSAYPCIQMMK